MATPLDCTLPQVPNLTNDACIDPPPTPPSCVPPQVLNEANDLCIDPPPTPPSCVPPQLLNEAGNLCVDPPPPTLLLCADGQVSNAAGDQCITPPPPTCTNGQVLNAANVCVTLIPTCDNGQVLNAANVCVTLPPAATRPTRPTRTATFRPPAETRVDPTSSASASPTSALSTPTVKSTAGESNTDSDTTTSSIIIAVVFILLLALTLVAMLIRRARIRKRENSLGGRFTADDNSIKPRFSNPFMKQKKVNHSTATPESIARPVPGMESIRSYATGTDSPLIASAPSHHYVDYAQQPQYYQQPQQKYQADQQLQYTAQQQQMNFSQQQQYAAQQQQMYYAQPDEEVVLSPEEPQAGHYQYPVVGSFQNEFQIQYEQLQHQMNQQMNADGRYYEPQQPTYVPEEPTQEQPVDALARADSTASDFLNYLDSNSTPSSSIAAPLSPIEEEEPAQSVLQTLMNQQQQIKVGRFEVTRSELSPEEFVDRAKNFSIYSDI